MFSTPGILRLPTEVLVSIFESQDLQAKWKDSGSIPTIRLTCRRFCALSSHLLIRKVYVDISQSETVDRLQSIAADAGLSKGVREVYLRVHFYHPWVAASFENFVASVESEWRQRLSSEDYREQNQQEGSIWPFKQIAWCFIRCLDRAVADDATYVASEEQSEGNDVEKPTLRQIRPDSVLQQAYRLYKAGYESQDRIMRNGSLNAVFSKSLSKFKDLRRVTIYDRELNNNWDPGTKLRVPQDDHVGQEAALSTVFSRPMVWEDAQWIEPSEKIRPGVPVKLLIEIPIAIGETNSVAVDYLDIQVTAAPDYTRLPTDPDTLRSLSAALDSINLFQFSFQPRCASGCGPWVMGLVDDVEGVRRAGMNAKSAAELQALDKYIAAILNCNSIENADINLGEFWYSAGFDSVRHAPTSLGSSWFHKPTKIRSLHLLQVPLTPRDLERFYAKVGVADEEDDEAEINLREVYLCNGTWKQFLETLRTTKRNDINIGIAYPLGGGMDEMDQDVYSSVWGRFDDDESMAQQYIKGRINLNPLG